VKEKYYSLLKKVKLINQTNRPINFGLSKWHDYATSIARPLWELETPRDPKFNKHNPHAAAINDMLVPLNKTVA